MRPIINELRPRPPRVCIKTRLFVTHLSRDRPRPAFVITSRRQTVSIRRRPGGARAKVRRERVGPAVSSREPETRIRLEGPSPPFPSLVSSTLRLRAATSIGYTVWVFLRSVLPVPFGTTLRRECFRGAEGTAGEGITTSRIVISRRERTPTRHRDFFVLRFAIHLSFSPVLRAACLPFLRAVGPRVSRKSSERERESGSERRDICSFLARQV